MSASSERRRVVVCFALGAVVAAVLSFVTVWQLVALSAWVSTAAALLVWVWLDVRGLDAAATAQVATREDDSRAAATAVLVVSSVLSLGAIVAALHRATKEGFRLEVALTVGSLLAVAVSWALVQTVFVLRYAHLYYDGTTGGVDFPGGADPSYRDFAYLAFTIGMTFQVSDTEVHEPAFRATVLRHSLLSYLFSIATIAFTINVLAGFVR
jgi:uncharacterized membrane protein